MKKKILAIVSTTVLASSVVGILPNQDQPSFINHQAEAATSSWKYFATKKGDNKGQKVSDRVNVAFLMGTLGFAVGGPIGAGGVAVIANELTTAVSNQKTVYFTDKIYIRNGPMGPQYKHVITYYKDKSRTKSLGKVTLIQNEIGKPGF